MEVSPTGAHNQTQKGSLVPRSGIRAATQRRGAQGANQQVEDNWFLGGVSCGPLREVTSRPRAHGSLFFYPECGCDTFLCSAMRSVRVPIQIAGGWGSVRLLTHVPSARLSRGLGMACGSFMYKVISQRANIFLPGSDASGSFLATVLVLLYGPRLSGISE